MRVCYFGTYDPWQPRTRVLIEGLRHAGVEVVECRFPLWEGTAQKVQIARQPWRLAGLLRRMGVGYRELFGQAARQGPYDAVIYGHLGQLDLLGTAGWFRRRGVPVIWDALISLYDTVILDRRLQAGISPWGPLLRWIDRSAGRLAGQVVVDTVEHADFWHTAIGIPKEKLQVIPVGAEDCFAYSGSGRPDPRGAVEVLFFGKYSPLHGIETIVRAAERLESHPISAGVRWTLVGGGQARAAVEGLVRQLRLSRVQFVDWLPYPELAAALFRADIALGIFGDTPKAKRVVPNKAYQALAAGCPLITAETPAARRLLCDGGTEGAVLVPLEDPAALAEAVTALSEDGARRRRLSAEQQALYRARYTSRVIGQQLAALIERR